MLWLVDLVIWWLLAWVGSTGSLCAISCWFPAVLPLSLDLVGSWLL